MKTHEWITILLGIIFGLIGWKLFENNNEWLSVFCVIPPLAFYLMFALQSRPE